MNLCIPDVVPLPATGSSGPLPMLILGVVTLALIIGAAIRVRSSQSQSGSSGRSASVATALLAALFLGVGLTSLGVATPAAADTGETCTASIAGTTWIDEDGDGIFDADESIAAGIELTLFSEDGEALASTTTDADGNYEFNGLGQGTYRVKITGHPSNAAPGSAATVNLGIGDMEQDVDLDLTVPVETPSPTASATSTPTTSPSSTPTPTPTPEPGSIGDRVWLDSNLDFMQSPQEEGIAGIVFELLSIEDGTETVVATTVSDANGNYLFSDLAPGQYVVRLHEDVNRDWVAVPMFGGSDPALDSDINPVTLRSEVITLGSGEVNDGIDVGLVPAGIG